MPNIPESSITHLDPELVHVDGEFCPSKNLNYKRTRFPGFFSFWFKKTVLAFERRLRSDLHEALEGVDLFPTSAEVHIAITFGIPRRTYSLGDIDNKTKTILDAMVGPVYFDDRQTKLLTVNKIMTKKKDEHWSLISVKILVEQDENCAPEDVG